MKRKKQEKPIDLPTQAEILQARIAESEKWFIENFNSKEWFHKISECNALRIKLRNTDTKCK